MADVVLKEVCKYYERGSLAVDRFSLVIGDGEFLVLVGPSGCGKSTTLRMIAGLEEISSGTISIGGRRVNTVPPKDRDIAMVFQNYALYPHMTAFDNMAFGLKLRAVPKREILARVNEAAEILGLGELLHRLPKQLSGGQRQRVAVGRAIVRKPKVFLFDEPLSNLDAKMRVEMRSELRRLHRRLGATMVYVTHDQTEAMTMGDRIVVMDRGTIQQAAKPTEVYQRPATRFVAGFIGTPPMNFVKGRIAQHGLGLSFLYAAGASLPVPAAAVAYMQPLIGCETLLGFRPEALGKETGADADMNLHGTVDGIEPMGNETFVQLVMEDGTRVTARVSPECVLTPGTTIGLPVDMRQALFFDAHSECVLGNQ